MDYLGDMLALPLANPASPTPILLVHAPYPGTLKFEGVPSSLFAAVGPFVEQHGGDLVSYLDPVAPSAAFDAELEALLGSGAIVALCISTSTAAIEEAARIAATAKRLSPTTLVVLGGPHEDDVDEKAARRIEHVDVSIAGEAEFALQALLESALSGAPTPRFEAIPGRFTVTTKDRTWNVTNEKPFSLRPKVLPSRFPHFGIFENAAVTIPLMASLGCPYGKCTFCAEAGGGVRVAEDLAWIEELAERAPGAALYFQDSIFPSSPKSRSVLLPLLRRLGRPWGCQVYLPMTTEALLHDLADNGCVYVYAGVESGSMEVNVSVGKTKQARAVVLERMRWMGAAGMRAGVSLMFGAMSLTGEVLETTDTVAETLELCRDIESLVTVAGFYPNVCTVLPGTQLHRGLAASGVPLDFYRMPRVREFAGLEDGEIGYNFVSLRDYLQGLHDTSLVAARVAEAATHLSAFACSR